MGGACRKIDILPRLSMSKIRKEDSELPTLNRGASTRRKGYAKADQSNASNQPGRSVGRTLTRVRKSIDYARDAIMASVFGEHKASYDTKGRRILPERVVRETLKTYRPFDKEPIAKSGSSHKLKPVSKSKKELRDGSPTAPKRWVEDIDDILESPSSANSKTIRQGLSESANQQDLVMAGRQTSANYSQPEPVVERPESSPTQTETNNKKSKNRKLRSPRRMANHGDEMEKEVSAADLIHFLNHKSKSTGKLEKIFNRIVDGSEKDKAVKQTVTHQMSSRW